MAAPITAMGRAAATTLAFRVGGELRLAVVVKATFVLAPDGPMVRVDPEPIARADQHRDRSPASSLVASGDLVPYRPRADVLLSGHARAPRDAPTPAMGVRLMVARGQDVVLDKRLAVRGTPDPSGRTREPSPFAAMSLAWELAAGGPENPVGIVEGPGAWPHIVDPRHRDRPAGFGPLSPQWPARRRLLTLDERAFAAPVPELPRDFAWAFFNAAPEDQRIDFFRGDEWIGFEGMNSQLPRVQSCLPGVRGSARVYGPTPELHAGQPLALSADTLTLDTDRLRCSVVWRGSFALAAERDLGALQIFAGVASAAEPLSFPAEYTRPASPPARPSAPGAAPPRPAAAHAASAPSVDDEAATREIAPAAPPSHTRSEPQTATVAFDLAGFAAAPVTPFGPSTSAPRAVPSNLPAATPFDRAPPSKRPVSSPFEGGATMDVSALLAGPPLPFGSVPAAPPAPRSAPLAEPAAGAFDGSATMDVGALLSGQALPFGSAPAAPPAPTAQPAAPGFDGFATTDLGAMFGGPALPFHAGPAAAVFATTPPGEARLPVPSPSAGATMDVSALLAGAALPFHGSAAPGPTEIGVAPPAPMPVAPIPVAPSGPLFPEVPRASASALASPVPVEPPGLLSDAPEGETPKTLGAFFLAAMARAGATAAPPAARAP